MTYQGTVIPIWSWLDTFAFQQNNKLFTKMSTLLLPNSQVFQIQSFSNRNYTQSDNKYNVWICITLPPINIKKITVHLCPWVIQQGHVKINKMISNIHIIFTYIHASFSNPKHDSEEMSHTTYNTAVQR